jgi:hypothetical protein
MKLNSFVWGLVLLAAGFAAAGSAYAQTFNYSPADVLVCFRSTGGTGKDLVVDAGSLSTFTNLAIGQTITISEFTGSQLAAAVGTNKVAWSVFASDRSGLPFAVNVWVTKPRSSFNTQTSPWPSQSVSSQGPGAGQMDGVGRDANVIGSGISAGANNTTNVLVEPESGNNQTGNGSYAFYVGSLGNFNGNFEGVVEQTTPAAFTTGSQNVRSDFYQLLSTSSNPAFNPAVPVTYLGYFEFSTNGVLTYTAGPSSVALTAPVITAFTRIGTTNTVTFTTGSSGTYSLCGTNSAGLTAVRANWPVISSVAGNGSPQSLVDVTTNSQKFYLISAQ